MAEGARGALRRTGLAAAIALACASGGPSEPPAAPEPAGPPPGIAANGTHYDYQGMDLVYDAERGAWRVGSRPDLFYRDGFYYWRHADRWVRALHFIGPWETVPLDAVPPGLR